MDMAKVKYVGSQIFGFDFNSLATSNLKDVVK